MESLPEKWCVNRQLEPEIINWFNYKVAELISDPARRPDFKNELRGPFTHWPILANGNYTNGRCAEGYTLLTSQEFFRYVLERPEHAEDLSYLVRMFEQLNIV